MSDELVKLLLTASIDTLLAVTILVLVYFLARGRGKATSDETETIRKREENEGKLIDAVSTSVATQSEMKILLAKAVDLQADSQEWHRRHDAKIEATKVRIDDTNSALVNLNKSIKERSELDGQSFEELREDMRIQQVKTQESIDEIKASIDGLKEKIENLHLDDRDCKSFTDEIKALEDRLFTRLQQPVNAVATNVVTVDASTLEQAA